MTELVVYLLIATLFFVLGIGRPKLAFLALVFLLPLSHEAIQTAIFGYRPEKMTPLLLTVAAGSLFIATFFRDTRLLAGSMHQTFHVLFPYLMFLMTAIAVNFAHNGFTHSVDLLDNYIGPMFLFLLTVGFFTSSPSMVPRCGRIILLIMVVGVLFSFYEYFTGSNPVMQPYMETVDPLLSDAGPGGRACSFFGHYLVTASLFVFAMALAFALIGNWWALLLAVWFYLGIALTKSRAGLFVGAVLLVYGTTHLLARSGKRLNKKLAVAVALLVLIPALLLLADWLPKTTLFTAVVERFQTAPIQDRVEGLFSLQMGSWLGKGFGEGNRIAEQLGNVTGLENPWAYLVQDFGFVGTLFYASALISVLLTRNRCAVARSRPSEKGRVRVLKVFLFLQILMFSTFNGFGNRANANYIIWFLAALVVARSRIGVDPSEQKKEPSADPRQLAGGFLPEGPLGTEADY